MRVVLDEGTASEEALAAALRALGAEVAEISWGVGGAVEESVLTARFGGLELTMTLRSYEAPVVEGPAAGVAALLDEIAHQRSAPKDA